MTTNDAVAALKALVDKHTGQKFGLDREYLHVDADKLLCQYLKELGPEHAAVAEAFEELDEEHGFWYA